ncbi:hypothetical protein Tco_0371069 [Tanacetum coccineum]
MQAMIEADRLLAERLQAREQEELTDKEKARLHRARKEVAKKQKINDDQEEAEMKKHMEIVLDEEEIAVDAIPLATKPSIIFYWKIIKKGKIGYFQIIRADGSSKRPNKGYERVLWGDLKVMFEPDVESKKLLMKLDDFEEEYQVQGRIVGIKRLHDNLGVNTAKVKVTAVKQT